MTLVVQACLESGLVDNQLLAFDLTAVVASGHRWSPYERAVILTKALIRYLELCWAEQEPEELLPEALRRLAAEVALEVLPHKALEKVRPERVVESVAQGDDREAPWQGQMNEAVEEEHQQEEGAEESPAPRSGSAKATLPLSDAAPEEVKARLVGVAKKLMERLPHSRGDLDARVGRTTSYTWFCGYLLGFVVNSLQHVITAVVLVAGNVRQARLLVPALEAHCQRVGVPEAVALDSAFDDKAQVYDYLDAQGIEGHVTSRDHATPAKGGYGTDRLTWDEERGILRCPNGAPLRAIGPARPGPRTYEGTACSGCPVYDKCQPQGQGEARQFSLDPVPHRRWQENRTHCQTEEYKTAQDRRFVEEGRFGLAKMNHHGAKAPYRSRAMNYLAALLIAIVMNYCILAQHQPEERRGTL